MVFAQCTIIVAKAPSSTVSAPSTASRAGSLPSASSIVETCLPRTPGTRIVCVVDLVLISTSSLPFAEVSPCAYTATLVLPLVLSPPRVLQKEKGCESDCSSAICTQVLWLSLFSVQSTMLPHGHSPLVPSNLAGYPRICDCAMVARSAACAESRYW